MQCHLEYSKSHTLCPPNEMNQKDFISYVNSPNDYLLMYFFVYIISVDIAIGNVDLENTCISDIGI